MQERSKESYLPGAVEAEKAILHSIFMFNGFMRTACAALEPWEFLLDSHRKIFETQREIIYAGEVCDEITILKKLGRQKIESMGGFDYIIGLGQDQIRFRSEDKGLAQMEGYVRLVKEKSRLRDVIRYLDEATDKAVGEELTSSDIANRMIALLQDVANQDDSNDIEHIATYLNQHSPEEIFEQMRAQDGVPTGIADFDEITGGLQKEELVVIAARPSMGKTAWVAGVLYHTAVRNNLHVAGFVLEQRRKFIVRRMLSHAARVNYTQIKKNDLSAREREILLERRQRILESNLYLEDRPGLTASRIRAKCAKLKARGQLDLVIIDQLSHVDRSDVMRPGMQIREAVGLQTKIFKRMAQDLNVPVVVLNQLSREAGKRKDFRPTMSDLKESGNIEEDADVVAFLHRPEYYERNNPELKGKAQIILEKNREGSTGTVDCEFHGQYMMWTQEAQEMPDYEQRSFSAADDYLLSTLPEYDDPRWK